MSADHTADRYERLRQAFLAVCEVPTGEREAALDAACGGDDSLRAEVLALLAADAEDEAELDLAGLGGQVRGQLADLAAEDAAADAAPLPEHIGPYRILGEIGSGGMGRVLRAEQEQPHRVVALKVLRPGATSEHHLRRFRLEAEVLGRLRHPGIARIYDAGTADTPEGPCPYFAMELVEGVPLLQYAGERGLDTAARLELLASIADAVQHAHGKGIVHRDLKPANVLVEADGTPRVLDFGVARVTDSDLQLTNAGTAVHQLVGTIPYMSPEQAGGDLDAIDTRSDVYALGVLLFELLGERLPHQLERKLPHEAVRVIRDEEPTRLGSVDRAFRGDLETIAAKALEKEPGRRYQTSADLAADLRRFLADEPIEARPPSSLYQLQKFTRRNRALVGGVVVAFACLVAGLAGTSWAWGQAVSINADLEEQKAATELARQAADAEAVRLRKVAAFNRDILWGLDPAVALSRDTKLLELVLRRANDEIRGAFEGDPTLEADVRLTIGGAYMLADLHEDALRHFQMARAASGELGPAPTLERLQLEVAYGDLMVALDRTEEAMSVWTGLLAVPDPDRPEVAAAQHEARFGVGLVLLDQGRGEQALVLFEKVVAADEHAGRPDDELTLGHLEARVRALLELARPDEALPLAEDLLARTKANLHRYHPLSAAANLHVGHAFLALDDPASAKKPLSTGLRTLRNLRGSDHPETLVQIELLARVQSRLGDHDSASSLARELARHLREREAPAYPDRARALVFAAEELLAANKPQQAIGQLDAAKGFCDAADPDGELAERVDALLVQALQDLERRQLRGGGTRGD